MRVSVGSVSVRYYPEHVNGCQYWTVYRYSAGKRVKERLKSESAARERATEIATDLSSGIVNTVTGADAAAVHRVRAFGASTPQAVDEWISLRTRLPGVSISDLVSHWERSHAGIVQKSSGDILAEMIDHARKSGRSAAWLAYLSIRAGAFCRAFPVPIGRVARADIEHWLDSKKWRPVNLKNYLSAISALAGFAKSRKYLAPDWDELSGIPVPDQYTAPIEIYTPEEMKNILDACPSRLRAAFALGAFAGLRQSEVVRLSWADVRVDHIVVGLQKVRSAGRRIVPMRENLRAWLDLARGEGRVVGYAGQNELAHAEKNALRSKLKRNGLRHSYISYRMAEIADAPRVASECGNSPAMIFAHYREIVTPAQAAEWFGIVPQICPKPALKTDKSQ